jgi:hypothetical protein
MYIIPEYVLQEFDFIKNANLVSIKCHSELQPCLDANKKMTDFLTTGDVVFHLLHETIHTQEILDDIVKNALCKPINFKIFSATSTKFKHSTHPLTNLITWNSSNQRVDISNDKNGEIPLFNEHEFPIGLNIIGSRKYRGILSVRKNNPIRDLLFSSDIDIKNGICRYAQWPHHGKETTHHQTLKTNFPTWTELIEEYKNSMFSFIVETRDNSTENMHTDTGHNTLGDKTLLSFLTGTLPIVLGGANYISELESMGFKVWNNHFGFDNVDTRNDYKQTGTDYFRKCIDTINLLTMEECTEYWLNNKQDIQHNYDIASSIICNSEYNILN